MNETSNGLVMAQLEDVDKEFDLRHTLSIKEYVVWWVTGRKGDLSERFKALDGVSMTIHQGEAVALLGFNGSGKSTTLKLISGVMLPDAGSIGVRGRIAGLIEVGAGMHPDLTGRENVYLNGAILGMSEQEVDERFDAILEFSGIEKFIDTEVKFYSSGMYMRLAFSVAVHSQPDIFLVDEVLAVGDEPFQRKCIAKMRELRDAGQTLVVVSHDLELIKSICHRGIVLEHGKVVHDSDIGEAVDFLRSTMPD